MMIRKKYGCSPFFMVTGAHPILPLDIQEATWLVELPGRTLTMAELIGFQAKALAKHQQHVKEMRSKIDKGKKDWLVRYEKEHKNTIKDWKFEPGDLVLIRNMEIESSLDKKMKPHYTGCMIVISRSSRGSYMLAEMDGAVLHHKVRAFRVIPYFARKSVELPDNVHELIDVSKEALSKIELSEDMENDIENDAHGKDFNFKGVRIGERK